MFSRSILEVIKEGLTQIIAPSTVGFILGGSAIKLISAVYNNNKENVLTYGTLITTTAVIGYDRLLKGETTDLLSTKIKCVGGCATLASGYVLYDNYQQYKQGLLAKELDSDTNNTNNSNYMEYIEPFIIMAKIGCKDGITFIISHTDVILIAYIVYLLRSIKVGIDIQNSRTIQVNI
jgi:hypothetical protein